MPFRLITAPATFSRLMRRLICMRKIFSDMYNVDNFIDYILVYTMTFEQHLKVLKELFQRLHDAVLTAKPNKCSIAYSDLNFLAHACIYIST